MSALAYFIWFVLTVCALGFAFSAAELFRDWRDGRVTS